MDLFSFSLDFWDIMAVTWVDDVQM
jgi:hypothetical protein